MKKIAFIILSEPQTYPPTINAANILTENGWIVDIYGIKYETSDFLITDKNVNFHYIGNQKKGIKNILQYLYFYLWAFIRIKKSNSKLIYSFDPMSIGPSYFISTILGLKWFYHVHDVLDNPIGWYKFIKWLEKKYAKKAFNISFPQIERAEMYKKAMQILKPIDIVFNGPRRTWGLTNIPDKRIENLKNTHKNIIIYQGGISKKFNFEIMLNAINLSKSTFAFCIIGRELESGSIKYYQEMISIFGLKERVFFLPPTNYDYLPSITSQGTIGLAKFTSDKNAPLNDYYLIGASNKIAEYLSMSLPIIFPNTSVNIDFLKHHKIGLACNSDEPIELAKTIDSILLNKKTENEMRKNAREIFENNFNFDSQYEKILFKLEEVIK